LVQQGIRSRDSKNSKEAESQTEVDDDFVLSSLPVQLFLCSLVGTVPVASAGPKSTPHVQPYLAREECERNNVVPDAKILETKK